MLKSYDNKGEAQTKVSTKTEKITKLFKTDGCFQDIKFKEKLYCIIFHGQAMPAACKSSLASQMSSDFAKIKGHGAAISLEVILQIAVFQNLYEVLKELFSIETLHVNLCIRITENGSSFASASCKKVQLQLKMILLEDKL